MCLLPGVNHWIVTMRRPIQSDRADPGTRRDDALPAIDMPDCVCGALRMATRAITQRYDDALRASGLRVTQYSLLSRIERLQPISAAALVDSLIADQTTLARALKVLEQDGLIRRVTNTDKRVKRIELTEKGGLRVAHARRLWRVAQDDLVRRVGQQEWRDTRSQLLRLVASTAEAPTRAEHT